ncbi:OmpA family protein, partial [uncultured Amaricoccus sp.]|uniref:OmpA family protein n=1 Tax=uncultured Amaricoccus sp. TaxID=339341 RepID=UPI0026310082
MRLRAIFFAVIAFALAAAAAWRVAEEATARYEAATAGQVRAALAAADQDWAEVATDGLKVTLTGAVPDEASRFRALETTRQIVDGRRIEDLTTLAAVEPLPPPPFALELLRNEADVSLIGLVPQVGGRDVIGAALRAGGLAANVTDMLESASDPAPEGWQEALGFGLSVLSDLPRAKISVAPGAVRVVTVADSARDQAAIEERLQRAKPEGVTLALEVSAPRAVIAPFAFDFSLAGGVGRMEACSAPSEETAATILAEARAAGLAEGAAECRVGLGSPSAGWPVAVSRGLEALRALGGGRFALLDLEAELTAPEGAAPDAVQRVAAQLDADLPDVFHLSTVVPEEVAGETAGAAEAAEVPPEFEATLSADGAVRLAGAVTDPTSRDAILSYAAALFGHDRVMDTTEIAEGLPAGWPGRVLAGVEALAALDAGKVVVTAEAVTVEGRSLEADAGAKVTALLAAKVPDGAKVNVAYDAAAAAAAAEAARPKPELCADQIAAILAAGSIQFAPSSAEIVPTSKGVIAAIADVLRACPGADFEIGGHTDSQGSAEANQRLSEARAQAVLAALRAENLPLVRLTARGFGASVPAADNATESGRAANRRIEFRLIPESEGEELEEAAPADGLAPGEIAEAEEFPGEACAAQIEAILAERAIEFSPGAAELTPESGPVLAEIGATLRGCPEAVFEIGGHTDAQGSESGNLRLSQERAEAVLAALRAEGLALPESVARGFGEAEPVADNATAEGRAQNRRIAFTLTGTAEPAPEASAAAEGEAPEAEEACLQTAAAAVARAPIAFAPGSAELAA